MRTSFSFPRSMHSLAGRIALASLVVFASSTSVLVRAGDWLRFRGPNGSGVSPDSAATPVEWSQEKNLRWKVEMPGPGSSCPIVVGGKVIVTCWTGYGTDQRNPGDMENLKRHVIAFDRASGKQLWSLDVPAVLPEDRYGGMFAEHGYASHTPASDGKRVFAYLGKTGLVAMDLDGKELWRKSLGTGSGSRGWGSASSPIVLGDLVIATATAESRTIAAFRASTGEEVWKQEADGFESTWGTPVLLPREDGQDLVIAVPYELWALNPETGKLRWYCESVDSDTMCSSAVVVDDVVYAIEGRSGGGIAVRGGGKGDVGSSHVVWRNQERGRISTPVHHDGRLYFVASKIVNVLDAKTGQRTAQLRLPSGSGGGGDDRGGRGGRGGGGFGGQDYSSPVIADGKLYYFTRRGEGHVVGLGEEAKVLATNRFDGDTSSFSSSPAISDGEIFVRSDRFLYAISSAGSAGASEN